MLKPLDPEAVERARLAFNTKPKCLDGRGKITNNRLTLSFDELLERFSLDCNSFTDIGNEAGVTRERIRQIYNQYFRSLFGESRTGRARVKVCTRVRRVVQKREAVPIGSAADVAEAAATAGLSFEPYLTTRSTGQIHVSSRLLYVNGVLCVAKRLFTGLQTTPGTYHQYFGLHRFSVGRERFVICLTPAGTFVIPASVVPPKPHHYYIPTIPPSKMRYTKRRPTRQIDFWQYHEAWHLIP